MPKRYSRRTRVLAALLGALRADIEQFGAHTEALTVLADELQVGFDAFMSALNNPSLIAAARELEAKVAPVQLSRFTTESTDDDA